MCVCVCVCVWLCASPAPDLSRSVKSTEELKRKLPALRAALPRSADPAGIPLYVVDPNGFVILRYAPQADPAGLRADVARLLKLK